MQSFAQAGRTLDINAAPTQVAGPHRASHCIPSVLSSVQSDDRFIDLERQATCHERCDRRGHDPAGAVGAGVNLIDRSLYYRGRSGCRGIGTLRRKRKKNGKKIEKKSDPFTFNFLVIPVNPLEVKREREPRTGIERHGALTNIKFATAEMFFPGQKI